MRKKLIANIVISSLSGGAANAADQYFVINKTEQRDFNPKFNRFNHLPRHQAQANEVKVTRMPLPRRC